MSWIDDLFGSKTNNSGTTPKSTGFTWDMKPNTTTTFNPGGFSNRLGYDLAQAYQQGPQVYNKSMYAGVGETTKDAWNDLLTNARSGARPFRSANDAATDFSSDLLDTNGLVGSQKRALSSVGQLGTGYGKLGDNGGMTNGQERLVDSVTGAGRQFGDIANGLKKSSLTENELMQTAQGNFLGGGSNPYAEQVLQRSLDDARSGVNASIGASGRFGSGMHIGELSDKLGGLSAQFRNASYENERDRQIQALGLIEGQRDNDLSARMSALGSGANLASQAFGLEQQGVTNQFNALAGQLGAAGQAFGMGQQGDTNALQAGAGLGDLYQQSQLPAQTELLVGGLRDANQQAALNGRADLWSRQNNAGLQHVQQYLNPFTSSGGFQQQTTPNPLMQILGYVSGNAGQAVQSGWSPFG